jgi:hypothetical protein
MEASKSFPVLMDRLRRRFEQNPNRKLWLVGIVFCRPQLKLAREEIIPSLSYFHRESGRNIDFFFAGFDGELVPDPERISIETGISSTPEWQFDPDEFARFADEIRIKTNSRYRYTGGCDVFLMNCVYSPIGEPKLDFERAALAPLEVLRNQGRLPDTSHFFKSIFDYCRAINNGDPTWGFGVDAVPGSPLIELCEKFLKQSNEVENLVATKAAPTAEIDRAKPQLNQQPGKLLDGPFRYDLQAKSLIMPSGIRHRVDTRYAEVLDRMFTKEDGFYSVRKSDMDYVTIAALFEVGRWKERHPKWSEAQLEQEARAKGMVIRNNAKKLAQEFRRQFSRWLRDRGIDAGYVITVDRKNDGYKLGAGWHPRRAVIRGSEVGLFAIGNEIENFDEETEDDAYGKPKAKHFGSESENYNPQGY